MYAPHTPLWAVTYHAFQTSSHGKYRLMAKQQAPNTKDESEVASILLDMQEQKTPESPKKDKTTLEKYIEEKEKEMEKPIPKANRKTIQAIDKYIKKTKETHFDKMYDDLLTFIEKELADVPDDQIDSKKIIDALQSDKEAFEKALQEEEKQLKKEDKNEELFEKALNMIRKRGELLFKEKEKLQKILDKDTAQFERAIRKEEKEEDTRQKESIKVISNVIDIIEKQELKEQKQNKETEKELNEEDKAKVEFTQAAKNKMALTNDLFNLDGDIKYGDGFVQSTTENVIERLTLPKYKKTTYPQAAIVRRVDEEGQTTKKDINGYQMEGKSFKRLSTYKPQIPLMKKTFFDSNDEIYMPSDVPTGTFTNEDKRTNMKLYTWQTWMANIKDGKASPLSPAYIQMKSLAVDKESSDILIAHQPGEGKTVNAILLAEMKRNRYIQSHKVDYDNSNRKWEFCRIVVTAPKSQILLQWQETVCKWGFDPRHWVFQTEIHFYRSQERLENYAAWNEISSETKDMYEEIWEDMQQPKDLEKMTETLREYKKNATIHIDGRKEPVKVKDLFKKNTNYMRNMITGKWFNLKNNKFSSRNKHFLISTSNKTIRINKDDNLYRDFKRNKSPEAFLCLLKQVEDGTIVVILHGDNVHKTTYKYITNQLSVKSSRDGTTTVSIHTSADNDITPEIASELKQCKDISQMKRILNGYVKDGGIKTVDKFVSKSHGRTLVQHRYIVEQPTIFIIDECHEALSASRRVMTTTETFDDQTTVEKNYDDFKKRTKTYFHYGKNTIANILVSATPMLADNPFKQLRIIAKFLNRETDFYGIGHSKGTYVRDADTLQFKPYPLFEKSCDSVTIDKYGDKYTEESIARRYVKYREVIDAFRGKVTRVQYLLNDEAFEQEMEKLSIDTYKVENPNKDTCKPVMKQRDYVVSDAKYIRYQFNKDMKKYETLDPVSLPEGIMQQYLYGNASFLSNKYWAQSGNGLVKDERIALLKEALKTLYVFRKSTFDSPFPLKVPVNDGYTRFERDIVRKYLSEHRGSKNILKRRMIPDMTTIDLSTSNQSNYVFHEQLSKALQVRYKHIQGFYPLVVTILDDADVYESKSDSMFHSDGMYVLKQLQQLAFQTSDKWIVVLPIPGKLNAFEASQYVLSAMKQVHIGKYEKLRATKGASTIQHKPLDDLLTDSVKRYLSGPNGTCTIKWLHLRQGDSQHDYNDSVVSIPGVLSSRIESIVLRIEECIANNKNVLVYNNNIEVLKAIEFGLKARRNRRVHLQDIYDKDTNDPTVKQWIREQKAKIYRKWSKWNEHHRQKEIDFLAQKTLQQDDILEDEEQYSKDKRNFDNKKRTTKPRPYASLNKYRLKEIIRNALGRLRDNKSEITMTKPYEYIGALNESKRIIGMYKIKNPTFNNIDGYWDTEEKGLVREKNEPWGYMPQTNDQYVTYILSEFKNERKQQTIITRIKSTITKHILQGKVNIVPSEDALFKAYHFYFKSIRRFEPNSLQRVLTICEVFMNGFIKKTFRGKEVEDAFLKKLKRVEDIIGKEDTVQVFKNPVNDFFDFCKYYYQMSMKDAMKDRKLLGGTNYWTDRLRSKVKHIWREDVTMKVDIDTFNNMKKLCKTRLKKDKTDIYYRLPDTYTVSDADVTLLKNIAKDIDPDLFLKDSITDQELIEASTYLYNIFNTEKIQEIKHAFGMQKFPVGGGAFATYMYLSPLKKKMMYGAVYDRLVVIRQEEKKNVETKIKELKKIMKKEKIKSNDIKMIELKEALRKVTPRFKKGKDGPDNNTIKLMYDMLKESPLINIPESEHAINAFIRKYERLEKLSTRGKYRFSTPDDFVEKLSILQKDISKTNHTFSINNWKYVDTCTFMGEYYSNNQMSETQSDLDFIEETKQKDVSETVSNTVSETKPRSQNNVPGRLRKSYQWQKRKNEFLRPHPLNSTMARKKCKENQPNGISDIDTNELKFSCLRQNINEDTYVNVKKRVLSQKDDASISKVSFGMLTGKHTPKDDDRALYKLAFECGMIDCLLMNKVCITGIDFESTRESECIISVCEKLPGVHDQFVGRLVRRDSHATCPKEFRRVSYNTFQETIDDNSNKYIVSPYHLLPSKTEKGLFDISDNASGQKTQQQSIKLQHIHHLRYHSDSEYEDSGNDSDSDNESVGAEEEKRDLDDVMNNVISETQQRGQIKEIIERIMNLLGWSIDTNTNLIKEMAQKVKVQYMNEIRINNKIDEEKFVHEIYQYFNTRRQRFESLKTEPNTVASDTDTRLFDHISYLTTEYLWKRRKVYYNISAVPVVNNHAFYSPYDLLESELTYEYGPRLWSEAKQRDEFDQGGLQVQYKWNCYVCNYESSNKNECEKCHARNLDKYYKMEPFYIDHDLEIHGKGANKNVDAKNVEIFKHNRMILDKTNLDLSMQSIEHVGKMKKDMIVQLNASERMNYFQRIQNNDSYNIEQVNSAIDILYKEPEATEQVNLVEIEYVSNDSNDDIQSEYDD